MKSYAVQISDAYLTNSSYIVGIIKLSALNNLNIFPKVQICKIKEEQHKNPKYFMKTILFKGYSALLKV